MTPVEFGNDDVERIWNARRNEAFSHLSGGPGRRFQVSDPDERELLNRVHRKADQIADAQTKREVGASAWQRFTNERALVDRRDRGKRGKGQTQDLLFDGPKRPLRKNQYDSSVRNP